MDGYGISEDRLWRGIQPHSGEWAYGLLSHDSGGMAVLREPARGCGEPVPRVVSAATLGRCTGVRAGKSFRGGTGQALLIWEGDLASAGGRRPEEVTYAGGAFRVCGLPLSAFAVQDPGTLLWEAAGIEVMGEARRERGAGNGL